MKTKVLDYAPDVDPTTQGILTDCANLVPSFKGYKSAPSGISFGLAALAAECDGAATLVKLDGTSRTFAGTATKLYEAGSATWTDVSSATYHASALQRWSFAQFGNVSLAVNKGDVIQATTSGSFSALTAPKASMIETVGQFVFIGDTNEGTYGDSPNRWWCSAIGDHTSWTPNLATQCVTGQFFEGSGKLTACKRLGSQIIFYKQNACFVGSYVNTPNVWDFSLLPGNAGALSNEAVVNVGTTLAPIHLFMGLDNFYSFNGATVTPIGENIKKTVFDSLNYTFASKVCSLHDRVNANVYFFYPSTSTSTGVIDKCVVYNYKTGRFGRDDQVIEAALDFVDSSDTWSTLVSRFPTWEQMAGYFWGTLYSTGKTTLPAIIKNDHTVYKLTGAGQSSSMTTGEYGDNILFSTLTGVKPQFITKPTSATMTNYYKSDSGDAWTTGQTVNLTNNRFDLIRSARWHQVTIDYIGETELSYVDASFEADGTN